MFAMPPTPPAIVQHMAAPQAVLVQAAAQAKSVPQASTVSRNTPTAGFGDYQEFGQGETPAVAMNNQYVIEVHQSQNANTLFYRVGQLQFNSGINSVIHWLSDGATQYSDGAVPAIAVNNKNEVLEVHAASSGGGFVPVQLSWRRGHLSGGSIIWDTPSINFAAGNSPAAALNDKGEALIVYSFQKSLYSMAGTLWPVPDKTPQGTPLPAPPPPPNFGQPAKYDNGVTPRIAINNAGVAIEVHQSEGATTLWWHLGQISAQGASREIQWAGSVQYDDGVQPNVALNNENHLMEIHKSPDKTALWIHRGSVNTITLPGSPISPPGGVQTLGVHWDNPLWVNPSHSQDVASTLKGNYGVSPGVAMNDDVRNGAPQERVIIVYRIDTTLYYQYSIWSAL